MYIVYINVHSWVYSINLSFTLINVVLYATDILQCFVPLSCFFSFSFFCFLEVILIVSYSCLLLWIKWLVLYYISLFIVSASRSPFIIPMRAISVPIHYALLTIKIYFVVVFYLPFMCIVEIVSRCPYVNLIAIRHLSNLSITKHYYF